MIKLNFTIPSYGEFRDRFQALLGNDNYDLQPGMLATPNELANVLKDREKRARYIVENEALETEIELFA